MKYSIPLAIRNILEEIVTNNNTDFCEKIYNQDSIIIFQDKETKNFFFKIERAQDANATAYVINFMPSNRFNFTSIRKGVPTSDIIKYFNDWKKIVLEYHQPSILFEDPFTQKYYNDLEPNFTLLDEDKDFAPYSIEQQKRIVSFLEKAKSIITENHSETDNSDIKETIDLINETKNTISQTTKAMIVEKIRKIVAKGFKIGLQIGEKLLIEFSAELAKKLILANS